MSKEIKISEKKIVQLTRIIDDAIRVSNINPSNIELWLAMLHLTAVIADRESVIRVITQCTKSEPSYAM